MRQLTPYEEFYHVPRTYELYIVNHQTYEKCFVGHCIDEDYLDKIVKEIESYLKDHTSFSCMVRSFVANEHPDNYMERVEDFTKTSLHWDRADDTTDTQCI